MKKRNQNLDILRVIASLAVVWLHVSAFVVTRNSDIHSLAWWTGNIADAFSRWCVPVFVMISGALLLSSHSNSTLIEFYKKRTSRLFIPIIFWTLVYVVFREFNERSFNLSIAAKSIIKGIPYYHLWYVYMLAGLYFTVPFLRQVVTRIDSVGLRILMAGCFTIAAVETLFGGQSATFLPTFLPFIGYFLAGHYLFSYSCFLTSRLLALIIFVCGSIIAIGTGLLFPLLGALSWNLMYNYLNPIVVVMSLCIFLLFSKDSIATLIPFELIQRIEPLTLGIYLIHPIWLWVLAKFGVNGFWINPVVGIPVTSLLAFTLSAVSAALLAKTPILRRIVS